MITDPILNNKSLRQQVYEYLRNEMIKGSFRPGSFLKLKEIGANLGISVTPLREALLQLEVQGFITIYPRRGFVVNELSLEDIKFAYQIIGALESSVVINEQDKITPHVIQLLKKKNKALRVLLEKGNYNEYFLLMDEFHDVLVNLSSNEGLKDILNIHKSRIYDFPPKGNFPFLGTWGDGSCEEHEHIIELLEKGDFYEAARYLRDEHWSFAVHEDYIKHYYQPE